MAKSLIFLLCAYAGDPELDAPVPAALARDLHPATRQKRLSIYYAHAQVILNSMHQYHPRLHMIYIRHMAKTLIYLLCACAGDTELDAPVPAALARDLHPATWRGLQLGGELQDFHLYGDKVHRRHCLPESSSEY